MFSDRQVYFNWWFYALFSDRTVYSNGSLHCVFRQEDLLSLVDVGYLLILVPLEQTETGFLRLASL